MNARLRRVTATPFSLPLARASKWGRWGSRKSQDHVLVQVEDDDGVRGMAEATPRPSIYGESQASVVYAIDHHYKPLVEGANPYDVRGLRDRLQAMPWNFTARAAIDIAIQDLLARRNGVTLAEQLGCGPRPVPITYMLGLRSLEETVEEANEVADRFGVRAFKVKLGGHPSVDRGVLEAVRRAGPRWWLTADANGLYLPEKAHSLVHVLEDMDVALLEDPFPSSGLSDSVLEAALPAGVVADEHMTGPGAAYRALGFSGVSTICVKPPRTGVLGSLAVAAIASAAGKSCWIGSQGVSEVGALASAHIATAVHSSSVPADLGTFLRQADDARLLTAPIDVVDGAIVLPSAPGSGAEIDPERLDYFRAS